MGDRLAHLVPAQPRTPGTHLGPVRERGLPQPYGVLGADLVGRSPDPAQQPCAGDVVAPLRQQCEGQLPPFDQAFATLIRDLDRRSLLDSTLVCVTSEFGRTPKINGTAGRDHWPKVFSIVMAGGGVAKGTVYGSSDATASEPLDNPLTVEDWATTVYHCLGIVAEKELMAPGNRPVEIVDGGKVLRGLLA